MEKANGGKDLNGRIIKPAEGLEPSTLGLQT